MVFSMTCCWVLFEAGPCMVVTELITGPGPQLTANHQIWQYLLTVWRVCQYPWLYSFIPHPSQNTHTTPPPSPLPHAHTHTPASSRNFTLSSRAASDLHVFMATGVSSFACGGINRSKCYDMLSPLHYRKTSQLLKRTVYRTHTPPPPPPTSFSPSPPTLPSLHGRERV